VVLSLKQDQPRNPNADEISTQKGSSQNAAPAIQNETAICTLSPLDAALTMRFAKNMQHDTSKVPRLPRKMTMEVDKVLRLPRKLQRIF
jgi:hypothetical protein